jgi:hypothetical protein
MSTRGQTVLDFTIGMSLFLLVLLFVLLFLPGVLSPVTSNSQEELGLTNRIADSLSEGLLGDPATPYVLNTTCTVAFFDDSSPPECRHSGSNLTSRLGLRSYQRTNVTLEADIAGDDARETLCWDDANGQLVEVDSPDCTTPLVVGPTPPADVETAMTARRTVRLEGDETTMTVEVW